MKKTAIFLVSPLGDGPRETLELFLEQQEHLPWKSRFKNQVGRSVLGLFGYKFPQSKSAIAGLSDEDCEKICWKVPVQLYGNGQLSGMNLHLRSAPHDVVIKSYGLPFNPKHLLTNPSDMSQSSLNNLMIEKTLAILDYATRQCGGEPVPIGWGGITSSFLHARRDLQKILTDRGHQNIDGNGLTAYSLYKLAKQTLIRLDRDPMDCVHGFVGATGSVGSKVVELHLKAGIRDVIIFSSTTTKLMKLKRELDEKYGTDLKVALTREELYEKADLVTTMTSEPQAWMIPSDIPRPAQIIIDAGRPDNINASLLRSEQRDDVLYIHGINLLVPNYESLQLQSSVFLDLPDKAMVYPCMGEVITARAFGLSDKKLVGTRRIEDVEEIGNLAFNRLGFDIAPILDEQDKGIGNSACRRNIKAWESFRTLVLKR